MPKIRPKSAKYIKLGPGGAWERLCLEDGTLRLAYYEVPHEVGLADDQEAVREIYRRLGSDARTASSHARQVGAFYHAPPETLWITFADGFLWWGFAKPQVEFLGQDKQACPNGSRLRRIRDGWRNTSLGGTPLRMSELNGQLTAVVRFQGTICEVGAFDYLVRKINDEDLPEVAACRKARTELLDALPALMQLLTWQDFELLVELIFAESGWRRIGASGGTQKTVDLELLLPSTGERAFVQVKSKTDQRQLDDYMARLRGRTESRMFYVYHSSRQNLAASDPRVILTGPERLAEMVLEAGLTDWLLAKAG